MGSGAIREVKTLADPLRAFRQHVHDELSIAHVWSGSTLAWIDGKEVPVSGECVVVIPPGIAHACNPVAHSGWNYTLALLDPPAGASLIDVPYRILPSTDRLRDSFLALREGREESAFRLLSALDDAMAKQGQATIRTEISARPYVLRQVMEHLRSHLDAPLSLDELCVVCGLSKYHLVRSFKQAYGLTPHACHLNLRVNEAKARLKLGQELAEVAHEAGFCDQSHFTRVFARCVGMTPAAYQKAMAIPSKTLPFHHH
jgi:AraC-like DNA-binding protein